MIDKLSSYRQKGPFRPEIYVNITEEGSKLDVQGLESSSPKIGKV